ncbi:hypothetical protein TNCV_3186461 [Trichonephila clavipes]|nr:hypothetical protein TNCV_3186461 [Trichonephila clavipes]
MSILTFHTYQKETEPPWDASAGCLKNHWPWEKLPSIEVWAVYEATAQLLAIGLAPAKVVLTPKLQFQL